MAATLGAPVTEPQGNSAPNNSGKPTSSRACAEIVEVICHTDGQASTSNRDSTCTLPVSATRARSLRSRSTIIRFSARSLTDCCKALAAFSSASGSACRGAVPFIGRVVICGPRLRKNNSGDTERICPMPRSSRAEYAPGWLDFNRPYKASALPSKALPICMVRLIW